MSDKPSIASLLNRKSSEIERAPEFPEATYRCIITGYKIGTFSKSGSVGVAFEFSPTACVEAEDDTNPELAAEIKAKLEKFGEWTKKVFGRNMSWFTGKEDNETHLLISPVTFVIQDKEGNLSKGASMFYVNDPDSGESGFVVDILHVDNASELSLGDLFEACLNKEFYAMFVSEPDEKNPQRSFLRLREVTSVG